MQVQDILTYSHPSQLHLLLITLMFLLVAVSLLKKPLLIVL